MKKKSSDYLGKGLIIALVLMVINLIGGFAHLQLDTWFKWLSGLVLIILLINFCVQYGKQQTNGVTFGNVFGYGFKISLIVAVLITVYTLLSAYLIFPEYIDQLLSKTRTEMEARGGMSDEQIDQALNITKKFMQPIPLMLVSFVIMLFIGTIGSLLGGAFAKKSEPIPKIFQDNP